ncbi:hypothetical protein Tco_1283345 [Tanacetum coccineum]
MINFYNKSCLKMFVNGESMFVNGESLNVEPQRSESCDKCLNLDAEFSKSKQTYNDLLKNYSQLEKHCIFLELTIQLNQEIFQKDKSCDNQNALEIQEYFEINDLKAQLQDKDTTICKLKDTIRSLRENTKEENVFNDQFNSIKQTRVRHKEQSDSLINKLNLKSVENEDLKAQIQDKVFMITSLKNNLRKLKGKEIVENVVHIPSANTIASGMFKLDLEPLPPSELDLTCKYATRIQELLVYVQDTCPNAIIPSAKKVTFKPMTNVKKVSNCGSKPPGNKMNDKILQSPSRNKKNKVEAQPRKVNKVNRVVKPVCDVDVKHSLSKANSKILCATCNKSMFDGVHDKCLLDLVQNGNKRFKWKPTGRIFTIVGNPCPLTRITSINVVSPKQTTSHSDEIQKPEIKVYSKKPKNVKNIGSSKIAKIVESKNANHSEPNQTCGSNATDIPSSSSLVMTGCPDCTLILERQDCKDHELTAMASKQFSSGPGLQGMTPATSSTGLGSNPVSQQPCLPPIRDDWDLLFQPMFDEYFNPPTNVVSPVPEAAAPRAEVLADSHVKPFHDDPLNESPHEVSTSQVSSSNVRQLHTPLEHLGRWTKDHHIANVIGDPSCSVSTRKQLELMPCGVILMPSLL